MPCLFCGGADGDGHLFWDCTFPPLVEIREHPEFHSGLGALSGVNGGSLWAENPAGSYTSGLLAGWQLRAVFDAEEAADRVPDELDVWTDGSLDRVSGTCSSGSVFFNHLPGHLWAGRRWAIWMIGLRGLAVPTALFLVSSTDCSES